MWTAIGAIGGALLGGLFGSRQASRGRQSNETMFRTAQAGIKSRFKARMVNAKKQRALQSKFAKHGIRWRVRDAKAAGLHPLYALGANVSSYIPQSISSGPSASPPYSSIPSVANYASLGQDIGASVGRALSPYQKKMRKLNAQAQVAANQKNRAIAAYYESQAHLIDQQSAQESSGYPLMGGAQLSTEGKASKVLRDTVKVTPPRVPTRSSSDPSRQSGHSPFWQSYEIAPGVFMELPASNEGAGEALQNLNLLTWPGVLYRNRDFFDQFGQDALPPDQHGASGAW